MQDNHTARDLLEDDLVGKVAKALWLNAATFPGKEAYWDTMLPFDRERYFDAARAALSSIPSAIAMREAAGAAGASDEYMSVTLSRDGVVTSHNAFDADFDDMVLATEKIISELQKRLSNRKFCPYSHGSHMKHGRTPAEAALNTLSGAPNGALDSRAPPKPGDKLIWARSLESRPLAVADLETVTLTPWGVPGAPLCVTLKEVAGMFPMGWFDLLPGAPNGDER